VEPSRDKTEATGLLTRGIVTTGESADAEIGEVTAPSSDTAVASNKVQGRRFIDLTTGLSGIF
jgi:hypothetical protein